MRVAVWRGSLMVGFVPAESPRPARSCIAGCGQFTAAAGRKADEAGIDLADHVGEAVEIGRLDDIGVGVQGVTALDVLGVSFEDSATTGMVIRTTREARRMTER